MTTPPAVTYTGRCIAPPLTDNKIDLHFPALLATLPELLHADYQKLLEIVTIHRKDFQASINMPSQRERNIMATKFEELPTSGEHRNAAFHLLWYVNELAVGRNPSEAK